MALLGWRLQVSSKVTKEESNVVTLKKDGKENVVSGDKILMSVGRKPVTTGFGLENLSVELF